MNEPRLTQNTYHGFTYDEGKFMINYENRIRKVQKALSESEMDVYVAIRHGTLSYLLGNYAFYRMGVVILREGAPTAIYWHLDSQRFKQECWPENVIEWGTDEKSGFREPSFFSCLADVLKNQGLDHSTLGIDIAIGQERSAMGLLFAYEYEQLKKCLPQAKILNGTPVIDKVMVIKEKEEITLMRQAASIADIAMNAALEAIKPGVTEYEIIGVIQYAIAKAGAFTWIGGPTEVISGYRAHYYRDITTFPSEKIIQKGDMVIMDLHPQYRQYLADFAQTAVVGPPNPGQRKIADVWKETINTLIQAMAPGVVISDVARLAQEKINKLGYGDYVVPGFFGHGLGTCTRIPPIIRMGNQDKLEGNMVVAAGCHIYQPGVGGMRLECPVLITSKGSEPLVKTPLELHVVCA